jgi:DNA-binding HxlR family transcriptional regulator
MKKRARPSSAHAECPIRDVLDGIGNKWSYLILLALAERPMRFGEFRAEIDDISQRALTETLRSLRRDGFVLREVFSAPPLGVRYRLTDLGESLIGPVRLLECWASENTFTILRHREVFDDAKGRPMEAVRTIAMPMQAQPESVRSRRSDTHGR